MNTALTEIEIQAAARDVQAFNESLASDGMFPVKLLSDMPNEEVALAREICWGLGLKLHIVETMRFEPSRNIINGMASNGIAFVSCPTLHNDVLWTIGHEMWHAGEQSNEAMFEPVLQAILKSCHPGLVDHRRKFESDRSVSERHVQSEVLADFNGEMWIDPLFWEALAASAEDQYLVDLFSKMRGVLESKTIRGRFGVQHFTKETAELRAELVQVWLRMLSTTSAVESN